MDKFGFSAIVGFIVGTIDIAPMIVHKRPRHTIVAAFIHYFTASVVILNIEIPLLPWWLKGGTVGLALIIPMLIHLGHVKKKPIPLIILNAIMLGTSVGIVGYFWV